MSVIGVTAANKIAATKVDDLSHYYVPNETARILYFRNRTEKNFTITTATEPYQEKYTDASDYTKRKVYYTLMSYMEQLEYAGGGTITVKAGNYEVTNNICIPSNVTIRMENGVTFTKKERQQPIFVMPNLFLPLCRHQKMVQLRQFPVTMVHMM